MIKIFCSLLLPIVLYSSIAVAQTFSTLAAEVGAESDVRLKLSKLDYALPSVTGLPIKDQAKYWHLMALVQQENSQFKESVDSATLSIEIIKTRNTQQNLLLARLYIVRSNSIYKVDSSKLTHCPDLDEAIKLLLALKTAPSTLATAFSQQSTCVYEKTNNVPKALAILDKAIALAQESQLADEEQATIYNETALIYRKLSIFDKAYQYNLIAKDKWLVVGDFQGVYFMLRNLIVAATDMGEFELAQQHINELLNFFKQHPEFNDLPFFANYHSAVLARTQNNWLLAISFFEKAILLKNITSSNAYIRAAYEQLSLMYYRNNQHMKSFDTLTLLEEEFSGLSLIKDEVLPLVMLKEGRQHVSLNNAYDLLEAAERKKRDFVQKSTAVAAQVHDSNLQQLDNLLLKQRFNYLAIIAFLIVILLLSFSYLQVQRRNTSTREKEASALLLEQKNQLLADVSHELATPLTVLKLQVESLKDDLEEDVQVTYNALDSKLDDIQHLISDIHQLAQSDVGVLDLNIECYEFNKILDHWQGEFAEFVTQNKLTFEIENNLPKTFMVSFDREKIKQVVTNLLANSAKYTDKPGKTKLSVSIKEKALLLCLEDSAPSVSDEELIDIFERLYRVESSRSRETGGSGLGLAICKSLIKAHDGTIWADQSQLGGLKISIVLPISNK